MMSIQYFETQMMYGRAILDAQLKKIDEKKMTYVKCSWEGDYWDMMKICQLKAMVRF